MGIDKIIAVVFSDLHIHDWKKYNKDSIRLLNALDVIKEVKNLCKEYDCPALFPGDLIHNERHVDNLVLSHVLPLFNKYFNKGNFNLYGVSGNHDQSHVNTLDKRSPSYIETFGNTFKNFHCVDFKSIELDNMVLHGIPYLTYNVGFLEVLESFRLHKKKKNILMIHSDLPKALDTNNLKVNSVMNIPKDIYGIFKRFDLVISGHIHKPQILSPNTYMIGAPQHQRRTDMKCRMGCWLIHESGKLTFHPFKKYPQYKYLKPGEKPKGKHFYVEVVEKEITSDGEPIKVDVSDRKKIARKYFKKRGIKNKKKLNKLKELLDED